MSQNQIVLGHIAEGPHRGERFCIPLEHTVFTGMSHISGKTTAEEAAFSRLPAADPPYRILVFLTKRGEKTFHNSHNIQPYFKVNFSWEYLASLMESAMKEKLKFERAWIIKLAKMTQQDMALRKAPEDAALPIAREILGKMIADKKTRDYDRNVYIVLAAYLDKVLPTLRATQWSKELQLQPGINVMDLTAWYTKEEIQMLIIRSCMEQILEHENNVIVGLPECWKMLPQNRNTPVKLYFEKYVREGATNGNYLDLDAQDLGGMDKTELRQVSVWVMGRMQEANEVQRLLKSMLGADIEASTIQTLPLGHFMVAAGTAVTKVYVWPYRVPEEMSIAVAKGEIPPEEVKEYLKNLDKTTTTITIIDEAANFPPTPTELTKEDADLLCIEYARKAHARMLDFELRLKAIEDKMNTPVAFPELPQEEVEKIRLARLDQTITQVRINPMVKTYVMNTNNADGKLMWLAKEDFFNTWHTQTEIEKALQAYHWTMPRITLYKALERLEKMGYLGKQEGKPVRYALAKFVEVR